MSTDADFILKVHGRIAQIGRDAWDACAAPTGDPFVGYDFLSACEDAGCAVEAQDWGPRHLSLHGPDDAVLGVMPLYLKGHSQGEYVFDHAWADAYERAGGRYYPKLLSAVPFTPAHTRRPRRGRTRTRPGCGPSDRAA